MIAPEKLIASTIGSKEITSEVDCENSSHTFIGKDGKRYRINYPYDLICESNCYSFALGWTESGNMLECDYVPGFISNKPFESEEELIRSIKADLKVVGRKIISKVKKIPEQLPEAYEGYWIKILISSCDGDVHFMRKDVNSGRWIHKEGWILPPRVVRSYNSRHIEEKDNASFDEYEAICALWISE